MRKYIGHTLLWAILSILVAPRIAAAQQPVPSSLCNPAGFALGFFNGVWNTDIDADTGAVALRGLVGDQHRSSETQLLEPIENVVFYNTTGTAVGATRLQDVAEVFIQRSSDLNLDLSKRWEFFWDLVHNDRASAWDIIKEVPGASQMANGMFDIMLAKEIAVLANIVSTPPTESDMARHITQIKGLITERKKLVFVGHSQGNLFMNRAYEAALKIPTIDGLTVTGANVKAVHVAPASPSLKGPWTLAIIDLVINGLRLTPGSVPPVNLLISPSRADVSGHMLVETYLDSARGGREAVKGIMMSAFDTVITPKTKGSNGFFTVTLTWNGPGDVDLHAYEPTGEHVYWQSKKGLSGELDTDNVIADGPEHYFASCDVKVIKKGIYRFGINNFHRATGRTATVQISSALGGELKTVSIGVGPELGAAGDASPIPVFKVEVLADANGKLGVKVVQ